MTKPAATIDDVIAALDQIIADSIQNQSHLGYFAALYRRVTVTVKEGIAAGMFQNGPRMERFDVIFANRYLLAYDQYQSKLSPSKSWQLSFQVAPSRNLVVLQHLLLGMNAHINLDLGLAAAEVAPGTALADLQHDFNQINIILDSLIGEVVHEMGEIWPFVGWVDKWLRGHERAAIGYEMQVFRDRAWGVAETVAKLNTDLQPPEIGKIDQQVTGLGTVIVHPGFLVEPILWLLRRTDFRSTGQTIDILNERLKAKPVNLATLSQPPISPVRRSP